MAIEQGADIEVIQGKGHGRHINKPALDADAEGEVFWNAGRVHAREMGIGGLGTVLGPLHGAGKAPGLVAHPCVDLASPGLREGEVRRLECLPHICESCLYAPDLGAILGPKHKSMNDFHTSSIL